MEFKRKGPEVVEVVCANGLRVLYSYGAAVALWNPRRGFVRVEGYTSRTTESHIGAFINGAVTEKVPPGQILSVVEGA